MSTAAVVPDAGIGRSGILDRERIVAKAGFNRWMVPPAALAIHLCIGMSYGLSVFWIPLQRAVGLSKPAACPDLGTALFSVSCDWRQTDLVVAFTMGIVFLGVSAALFGGWLERAGPRKAGVVAALCWAGGFLVAAFGVYVHQLWIIWLGLGLIGGIGLGLGYISPVSTLVKWFPDRRGMATGMAIMGFGGGAMIGQALANFLIGQFKTADSVGVWQAMLGLGICYFIYMMAGAFGYRVPPAGWRPDGWTPPQDKGRAMITAGNVHLDNAHKTPQFWLIWGVLFLNVSAGIGVLGLASSLLQQIFAGSLIGHPDLKFSALSREQLAATAVLGGAFVGLLSLFNAGGRFFWASLSDYIGRKSTYFCFFGIGMVLYALTPSFADAGSKFFFVAAFCIIISMYGGGFASVPAYLADIFGTQFVGAIHGRLLTAWSAAGVVGPLLMSYIHDAQVAVGVPQAQAYNRTLYILVGFLAVGFVLNALVRPVAPKWLMSNEEVAALHEPGTREVSRGGGFGIGMGGFTPQAGLAWAAVGIPFLLGVFITILKAVQIF